MTLLPPSRGAGGSTTLPGAYNIYTVYISIPKKMLLLQHAESPPLHWSKRQSAVLTVHQPIAAANCRPLSPESSHNMFEAASVDADSLAAILPGLLQRKWHHTFRVADAHVQLVRETLYHLPLSLSLSLSLSGGAATTSKNHEKKWIALSVLLSSWLAAKCLLAIESWRIPFAGL